MSPHRDPWVCGTLPFHWGDYNSARWHVPFSRRPSQFGAQTDGIDYPVLLCLAHCAVTSTKRNYVAKPTCDENVFITNTLPNLAGVSMLLNHLCLRPASTHWCLRHLQRNCGDSASDVRTAVWTHCVATHVRKFVEKFVQVFTGIRRRFSENKISSAYWKSIKREKSEIIHPLNPNHDQRPQRLNANPIWPTAERSKIDVGSGHQHVWETVGFAHVCIVLPQVVANTWLAKIIQSDPMNCGPQAVAKGCPISLEQKLWKHQNLQKYPSNGSSTGSFVQKHVGSRSSANGRRWRKHTETMIFFRLVRFQNWFHPSKYHENK